MAHLIVRQKVADFSKWKKAFDGDADIRRSGGSGGGHVFQSAGDPNEVIVVMEWDTMDNLQQFAQSDELKARMKEAGVTGPSDVYLVNLVDSPSS